MFKQKAYSAISIMGLTVGITFAMFIGVFVWQELQVNQELKDVDRLYLLETQQKIPGSLPPFFVPAMLGQRAVEKYPHIFEDCYRFRDRAVTISRGDKHFRIQSMIGDSTLIRMFGLRVLHGKEDNALNDPKSIVITVKTALQFFSRSDVVGETLMVSTENNGLQEYHVTAVIADLQKKNTVSDFMNMDAQVFLPNRNRVDFNLGATDDWSAVIISYLKLTPATTDEQATIALNKLLSDEAPEDVKRDITIGLSPLSDYYLITNHGAVQKLILALTAIAIFILLLAIVNFINITIARSFARLKEVGVRKVIGGVRRQVVLQFLAEATLFSTLAGTLALLFYELLHNYFGNALGMELHSITELDVQIWVGFVIGIILIGILAGAYPAIYLSATRSIELLKGKHKSVKGTIRFARGLIAVQFVIAVFIFTVSLIISKQITYIVEADLGYDKSHVMIVSSVPRLWSEDGFGKMDGAKNEFLSSASVESVSLSWGAPNFNFSPYTARINKVGSPIDDGIATILTATDEDYAEVYGLDVITGKYLHNKGEPRAINTIVINESAQKELNLQLGDKVNIEFSDQVFTITGIVRNFNFESFHKPIRPVAFIHIRDFQAYRYFSFALPPGNLQESIMQVEAMWKKVFPNDPFMYDFTDQRLSQVYKTELQLKKASATAAVLILVIVLTGVAGLVSLSVTKRTKEIGIRKVLGATVSNILLLMSREYVLIMTISFGVGIPLSLVFGWQWLGNFAYHTNIEWWLFLIPVGFISVLTLLIVIVQSMKASLSNPVSSLRYE